MSARSGHVCESITGEIICFGGFGPDGNPTDIWSSPDGAAWTDLGRSPWGIPSPEQASYDFDSVVVDTPAGAAVLTVGGDRETFEFGDPENYLRVDDDVWWWAPVA